MVPYGPLSAWFSHNARPHPRAGDTLAVYLRAFPTVRGWAAPHSLEVQVRGGRVRRQVLEIAAVPPLQGAQADFTIEPVFVREGGTIGAVLSIVLAVELGWAILPALVLCVLLVARGVGL